ncbi:MAG: aminotransferase class III-fold pyridoxal phosphate-dependent enzyme [Opitutus sp.]
MNYVDNLTPRDRHLAAGALQDFVPAEIFDIHTHPYHAAHFAPGDWAFLAGRDVLGCHEHRQALQRYMPATTIHGLYFGMPRKSADRPAMNSWLSAEVRARGTPLSRSLMVVSPTDDREQVATALRGGQFCGIKVYHCYANRPDTMNAAVEEYAPDWMWEILHEVRGVMMLHIVKDDAMEDPDNQASLRRLCRAYPNLRLILAHVARSFNYRNARHGLDVLADLDNAVIDTSAICEAEAYRAALKLLGPRRILWGSDFAVSELRGRAITTGERFFWLHPELIRPDYQAATHTDMTLIGIESLLSLREACEDTGLTRSDVLDIFLHNARRVLAPHLPGAAAEEISPDGQKLWQRARTVISGGTGLLSKRAEMFDAKTWPAYFSRCSGSDVWDLQDRRYVDFAGGVGAILLGYADPDVTAAVTRRLALGTYCSLVNPQEVELAEQLISLHPWAGKVRYARGGGDAMTMSVRIARAATGRSGVAFCGYHGWHDWYLAANLGETDALNGHLLPGLEPRGVPRELKGTSVPFRYNDLASLDAALAKLGGNLAAVVMEPMRSQLPRDNFIAEVAARCRAAGGVFIVDEVTSGLRHGFPGALARLGIEPDLAVYAKAMSNGIPFAAVVGREAIMQGADGSFISSSYWTDGIGPAAALAVLEKAERLGVYEIVNQRGLVLQNGLRTLAHRHGTCRAVVGGMPATPTMTFDLGVDAPLALVLYIRKMRARGFLVASYYYVMLAHDETRIAQLLAAADETLSEIGQLISAGTLAEVAGVPRGQRGFARLA